MLRVDRVPGIGWNRFRCGTDSGNVQHCGIGCILLIASGSVVTTLLPPVDVDSVALDSTFSGRLTSVDVVCIVLDI